MREICKEYKKQIQELLNNKVYINCVILIAILSYGFAISNFSVGVDDLCFDRYVTGTYIVSVGRWGTSLLYTIFQIFEFTPFWLEMVVTILTVMMGIVFLAFLRKNTGDKLNTFHYTIITSILISYPMLHQEFIYQSTNLSVTISNLAFMIIPVLIYEIYKHHMDSKWFLIFSIIMPFFISMYESCCQTYMCMVCIIAFLEVLNGKERRKTTKNAFRYFTICILVLAIGIIINFGIEHVFKTILSQNGILQKNYSTKMIIWRYFNEVNVFKIFKIYFIDKIANDFINTNYIRNFFILGIFALIFAICKAIKEKKYSLIFFMLGIIGANFIINILQARILYRVDTSCCVAIAFFATFILINISEKTANKILCILFSAIVLFQTKTMNQCFYNDYVRYKKEANYMYSIANEIIEKCEDTSKPIVYIFKEHNGIHQNRINEDNGWSIINWGKGAFNEPGTEVTKFMNSLGYNFTTSTNEQVEELMESKDLLQENERIQETEKYIVVKIDYNI